MPNRNSTLALYLAKVESVEGTDPTPTPTANAIELSENFDPTADFAFKNDGENRVHGPFFTPGDPMSLGGKTSAHALKAFLRGTPTAMSAGSPIELDPWFRGAMMAPTYVGTPGSESVTYACVDTAPESITEWYYRDGKVYKFNAVRGDLTISFDAGASMMAEFAASGRGAIETDAAVPTNPVFSTAQWPVAQAAPTFTIDGFTAGIIRQSSFSLGNSVQRRDSVKAPTGIQGFRINKRNPTFKIVLEDELHATKDFEALRDNATAIALTWVVGSTQYNTWTFTAAHAFIRSVVPGTVDGLAIATLEGILRSNTPLTLKVS